MSSDARWSLLAAPGAYPDDPSAAGGVEWIQTHLSHVFLTAARVYKFRKPVDLGFVHFATLAERNADCLREVALNRRLAPDVYLGVAPLYAAAAAAALRVGVIGETLEGSDLEHCVVMRRLPDGRNALALLERGDLGPPHLDALAERIARFHSECGLGTPAPFDERAWRARCTLPVAANFASLSRAGDSLAPPGPLARARKRAERFVAEHGDRFERRRRAGRVVDGHGDLHLQHVWYEAGDAEPIAIDCLEFDRTLRCIDAACEVAFPAMDLRYRGERGLAERFLRRYARESDDFDLYSVVDYFVGYRAGVRAKVAALAASAPEIAADQRARRRERARPSGAGRRGARTSAPAAAGVGLRKRR